MNKENSDTIPLAAHRKALREAEREVLDRIVSRWSGKDEISRDWICELRDFEYPEIYDGPVVTVERETYRVPPGGRCLEQRTPTGWEPVVPVDVVRAVAASLLPREPVAVTEAMVEKAWDAFCEHPPRVGAMRRALLAVAADLAGPVGEKPKATRWAVVDNKNNYVTMPSKEQAIAAVERWDRNIPSDAPHRVVGFAEVAE